MQKEKQTYAQMVADIEAALAPLGMELCHVEIGSQCVKISAILPKPPGFTQKAEGNGGVKTWC